MKSFSPAMQRQIVMIVLETGYWDGIHILPANLIQRHIRQRFNRKVRFRIIRDCIHELMSRQPDYYFASQN